MAIEAAPDEKLSLVCCGGGVMGAPGDGGDCISVEREGGNTDGGKYDGLVAASAFSDAGLSKAVQAPGPYIFFILLNCERMVNAAADQSAFFV